MASTGTAVNVESTFGALLAGGTVCTLLSGIVSMQAYLYARMYRRDRLSYQFLVLFVWYAFTWLILDIFHTAMVARSNWYYLIDNFSVSKRDTIFWSVGVTVAITAVITFCTHCFCVHRLYRLSKGNMWLSVVIGILAVFRVASACVTTAEMIRLGSFSHFLAQFRWVFTLGLALSTAVDILIAFGLCYFLRQQRTGSSDMDLIIDSVILYTVENGILTCMATITALVCWLVMPHNLVFMGLHFIISKLYANSLLASLNARKSLRRTQAGILEAADQQVAPMPRGFPGASSPIALSYYSASAERELTPSKMQISVQKTVDYVVDGSEPYLSSVVVSRDDYASSRVVVL